MARHLIVVVSLLLISCDRRQWGRTDERPGRDCTGARDAADRLDQLGGDDSR
jgi:hypothetical protein